ncbi:MJ1255/VC2487 family glycosyltransferase [Hymenobacter jeollabukensis]|uniref:UDP-glucuronosyltransferase n=1 Tax=Hymenobacter jeollabukensis TaxID=2025313 RepID=A0A5R8WR55_9BACT|nr:MJ1255/VC2487 family glycosyltransferase [Hymenobacter jeollabukensis]TLM93234.1 UDP-glucuronosyltransferase [Hymenobacter jeollabukensis]
MNILYGVPGEGLGHATRSKVVIRHLLDAGHEVQVVSSSRAYKLLADNFPGRVREIKGFHLAYKELTVSKSRTAALTLRAAPDNLQLNFRRYRDLLADCCRFDLVVSDFESFSYFFAKTQRLPVISIDNMQIISRTQLDVPIPREERGNFELARGIVRAKLPRARHYFVTTFFRPPVAKPDTTLVPPIIRPEIVAQRPTRGQHVLVYQSSTNQRDLVSLLQQLPGQQFRVYGFNRDEEHGNVQLRSFSEAGFIDDLASARAVVTNGGFSLISEAVYLHKPVCAIPIPAQFEQWLNAAEIERLGYGRHFPALTPDNLKAFLYDLTPFEQALSQYRQEGNQELFRALDAVLVRVLSDH